MSTQSSKARKISVIGLGYVGLPVAIHFGQLAPVIGFDKSEQRIAELKENHDRTNEVSTNDLIKSKVTFTTNAQDLAQADFHIIAVPTPINKAKHPDLTLLLNASKTVAEQLKKGDIIVYESTVYPGATEDDCIPILEKYSGLQAGKDFFVGYSPERINPGDKQHNFANITKIVSGQDENTLNIVAETYSKVVKAGVHRASSIKVAEAAKVIENTQRDLNIALMNELALIFKHMNIDTDEVLKAAETKWNFLPFKPGLVGGHCIGVDPYYLTHQARNYGYHPEVILAGRRINDSMGKHIASQTIKQLIDADFKIKKSRIGVMGLTFKENCPDLRNTRVIDIINELKNFGAELYIHGPCASKKEAKTHYNLQLQDWEDIKELDAMIIAVAHDEFMNREPEEYLNKFRGKPIIIDVKSALNKSKFEQLGATIWRL